MVPPWLGVQDRALLLVAVLDAGNHLSDGLSFVGAATIVAGGLYTVAREPRLRGRRA